MDHNSIFPSTLFARLISIHPDKQDINFPSQTNEDQTTAEWRIYQSPNGEIFIKNISASYLQVNDIFLETSQEKKLFGGERLSFDQDSGLEFDYVFCFMNLQSDLKRGRDDEIIDSEKMKKLVKNDLPKELTCSICTNFLHKCMTLAPCQHSFCSFCLFDQLKVSSQCPLCRVEAVSVAKNPVLTNVIQLVESNFPISHKPQDRTKLEDINSGGAIVRNSDGVYIGSCVNGKKDGQGKMIYKGGSIYEGNWKNDKAEGKGAIIFDDGDQYDGFLMNNHYHGRGKYIWKSGKVYEGNFESNDFTGYGTMKFVNGDIYQGEWKNDKREGCGILTLPNGDKYEGKWVNGILQSEVKIVYSNGEKYEGEINVENLQRQGKGILILNNGDKYKGTWVDGVFQPKVTIEYSNRNKYEGEINVENLQKQGKGLFMTSDGVQYIGDWMNDRQNGYGKFDLKVQCEGLWEEGKLNGDGVITYADGSRYKIKLEKLGEVENHQEDSLKDKLEKEN